MRRGYDGQGPQGAENLYGVKENHCTAEETLIQITIITITYYYYYYYYYYIKITYGAEMWKFKKIESKLMSMKMNFFEEMGELLKIAKQN